MFQAFLSGVRSAGQHLGGAGGAGDAAFETVLRAQLDQPEHRLAAINAELAKIGVQDRSALPLLIEAGRCYGWKRDYGTQRRYAQQAHESALRLGDRLAAAQAGTVLAVAACCTGDPAGAGEIADDATAYVDELDNGELGALLPALGELSWVETQLQRLRRAEAHQRRGLRVAEAIHDNVCALQCSLFLSVTLCELGRLDEAWRYADDARKLSELSGNVLHRGLALIALGLVALVAGDYECARELAGRARGIGGAGDHDRSARVLLGLVMIRTDMPRQGRDLVLDAAGGRLLPFLPVGVRARIYAGLAFADAALGHDDEAEHWSELARRGPWGQRIDDTRGYAELARAEALLRHDPAGALAAVDSARRFFERGEQDLGLAAAWLLTGSARGRLGRLRDSEQAFGRAEDLYTRCGATGAARRVRLLRATALAATTRESEQERTPIECLSPREVQVARLIAEGKSNQQIAGSLDIKLNTVQVHVGRILRKLGVHSRTAVARLVTIIEAREQDLDRIAAVGT